jgi:catalase-peroxidase
LDTNVGQSKHGVRTKNTGALTNDFFLNLLDMDTRRHSSSSAKHVFDGTDRQTGAKEWTAKRVDLVFGSDDQLRALS